ncbi:MAG TPA: anhydro-N-acetylmuramic acid kinase [Candidatus Limiplasma sp.]|nr:anhydro-N-acetylmuramic acid kinase [Candidatus Limiplasma sp.]
MKQLQDIVVKARKTVIGLMSGTSADGIDAALVRVEGYALDTRVETLGFVTLPFAPEVRQRILALAGGETGGSRELCLMSFLLGQLSAEACHAVCAQARFPETEIDLIGSHGQTLWHIPCAETYLGHSLTATCQIGEASILNEAFDCPVVSDFRVRDMAAGGQGAPLVPYTEYLLYRSETETVALQNIGGIGNITLLPQKGTLSDTYAFDTGPGNMVMDALVTRMTGGKQTYDDGGRIAASGRLHTGLLQWMLKDDYLSMQPPKTTGRERYGAAYVERLAREAERLNVPEADQVATATRFTAESIAEGIRRFAKPKPDRLIVGGGGSCNDTLMRFLAQALPGIWVMTNEALGYNSDAKEAVAFAILANECVHGVCNNAPKATGARHPAVLGKISL